MSDDNKIKNYSAADIEKYWKGQLTTAEMYALEKAAMDDPFLADALEGYKNISSADIDILKQRLNERINQSAKVIGIDRRKFPWMKVAGAVVIIGGLGLLASQFLFNKKNPGDIATVDPNKAQAETKTTEQSQLADSSVNLSNTISQADSIKPGTTATVKNNFSGKAAAKTDTVTADYLKNQSPPVVSSTEKINSNPSAAVSSVPKKETTKTDIATAQKENEASRGAVQYKEKANEDQKIPDTNKKSQAGNNAGLITANKKANNNMGFSNLYSGRVLDVQNNPVPFANVMNTRDEVGTYSDAKGYFKLISADTALDLRIKSIGFETQNLHLNASSLTSNIFLNDDKSTVLNEVVIAKRLRVNSPSRQVLGKKEEKQNNDEPEPEDGWNNYDIYMTNNHNFPDELQNKPAGEIGLSFRIDKDGRPTDIKITKSLCKECDEEAVRLLKEGPKWKKPGNKSKTTVTIAVDR